jgi:hypothetical protein
MTTIILRDVRGEWLYWTGLAVRRIEERERIHWQLGDLLRRKLVRLIQRRPLKQCPLPGEAELLVERTFSKLSRNLLAGLAGAPENEARRILRLPPAKIFEHRRRMNRTEAA